MTHQLSHRQTALVQVILVLLGLGLPSFILIFFILGSDNLNVIELSFIALLAIMLGLSIFYFSANLSKVTFNRDYIYLSRLGKKEKINLEKIFKIQPGYVPFRLFYRNIYLMTVIYFDNQKKYKIQFISKGATGLIGTVNQIPLLATLRQFIKDRKSR